MQQNFLQQNYPVSSKTTVFLPDGGLVDAAFLPLSSRIYVNGSINAATSTTNNLSVKTGLNSSKITPIQYSSHHRDKLNLIRDSLKPFEQGNDELFCCDNEPNTSTSNHLLLNNNIENLYNENNKISEKIQNLMICALSQKGYDKESAYYALKLVNFSSVMDAAKVLLSIKKNSQNTHEENSSQSLFNYQQPHFLVQQQSELTNNKQMVTDNNFFNNSEVDVTKINSNATPLLSSNGIAALSRYGVVSKPIATTITVGSKIDTTFSPNVESHQKLSTTSKLFINNYSTANSDEKLLKKTESVQKSLIKDLPINLNLNSNSNHNWLPQYFQNEKNFINKKLDQQKSFLALEKNDYQTAPNSLIVLQQNNSFDQHKLNKANESNTHSPRQIQTSSSMVIKIDKNDNDCYQSFNVNLSNKSNLNDQSNLNLNDVRQKFIKFSLTPAVSTSLSIEKVTKTSKTTIFSPNLQRNLKNDKNQTTEYLVKPFIVQNIYVDPDIPENLNSKILINPPDYKNYIDQKNNCVENTQFKSSTENIFIQEQQKQPQRCISPLPESIARRLNNGSYEKFIKPCKAAMFRFFMEQHIEKLIQQYRERNQRAIQLTKEMEAAELTKTMKDQMLKLLRQKESKYIRLKRQKMNKNMFDMIRHIGVGAFGKVTLVRKKDTNQIYAMKTLSKEDVIQKQQAAHVKAERDILAEANSNWIVKLFFSFQDSQNLYFIMEYVPGGDMMQLLINKGIFSERLARFYIAELTCAIEYVHSLGFIHRDIKPDNILIDKNGHIKLTDFGLCTGLRWTHDKRHYVIYDDDVPMLANQHSRDDSFSLPPYLANSKEKVKLLEYRNHKKRNQAHSVVGTGNYMAPEVIKKTGHTQLCDWWSVGVILYEMVYGRPPFMSHNENSGETQFMIVNWRKFLDLDNLMGARLSRNCVDIIAKLCCDQEFRLGKNGAKEIKAHLWFKGIDFANLRSTQAEYIPRVEHAEDTSNFDTFEVNAEEFFKTRNLNQQPYNPAFFDFTFRHFFASEGGYAGICNASNINGVNGNSSRMQQQRPSLAPLIEQANIVKNDNKIFIDKFEKNSDNVKKNADLIKHNSLGDKILLNSIPSKKIPAPLAPTMNNEEKSKSNVNLLKIVSNKDIVNYKNEKNTKTKDNLSFYVV